MKRTVRTLVAIVLVTLASCGEGEPDLGPEVLTLAVVSGNDQEGVVGKQLAEPLVVEIKSPDGGALADRRVTFTVVHGSGQLATDTATTGANGLAQSYWTLGTSTADSQQVQVSIVGAAQSPGSSVAFHATAVADAPAALSIEWDTLGFLNPGRGLPVHIEGMDQFSNLIPTSALAPQWLSSDPTIAIVNSNGFVQGVGIGDANVTASAGSATAAITVRVRPASEVFPVSGYVSQIMEAGGRLLAVGHTVWGWNGSTWIQEGPDGFQFLSIWIFPDGTGWAGGVDSTTSCSQIQPPVWSSVSAGHVWIRDSTVPPCHEETLVTGLGNGTVFLKTTSGGQGHPVIRRRDTGGWTDLQFPALVNDSILQTGGVLARASDELYVGGIIQPAFGIGGRAILAFWDGNTWAFPTLPITTLGGYPTILQLYPSVPNAPVYGLVHPDGDYPSRIVSISGGIATLVNDPLSAAGIKIRSAAVGPDGRLALMHVGGIVWQEGGTWRWFDITPLGILPLTVSWGKDGTKWVGSGGSITAVR